MKTVLIGNSSFRASRLAFGCWRIAGSWNPAEVTPESEKQGRAAILAAYDAGYTLYDHADIYCDGRAESLFGAVLKEVPGLREQIIIASKCGIRKPGEPHPAAPYRYDFSPDYIVWSCEQSLRRLGVETIDLYQLHRPDFLGHPGDIAEAFLRLRTAGKVREFGVSNFRPSQLAMLQKHCPMPLLVNQVEISLGQLSALENGTLDQCLADNVIPLAWSPLAGGQLGNGARRLLPSQTAYRIEPIVAALDQVAQARGTHRTAVALAWLLRHPAGIIPIVGTTDPQRIRESAQADTLELSHEEWYRLLQAARGEPLP